MNNRPFNILILCHEDSCEANTINDHISSFKMYSRHKVFQFDPYSISNSLFLDLGVFDVVIIHYSISIIHINYLSHKFIEKIKCYNGLKVQFIQDDYRQLNEYKTIMRYLDINILFTPYSPEKFSIAYDETSLPGVVKISTLTGYVPDYLMNQKIHPIDTRPIDVGYRGREIPYWLGKLSQEKVWIGREFLQHIARYDLQCDISWLEKDRIYGDKWPDFIGSCKAILGTESGASITDFDGSAERRTRAYLAEKPGADFWQVHKEILKDYEGNLIENVISPRVFEAAALKTALVLFPGDYSGIITPWTHYIPLEKDFSNIEEVVDKIKNNDFLKELTERTHNDLIKSGKYSYRMFIKEFDDLMDKYAQSRCKYLCARVVVFIADIERYIRCSFKNELIYISNKKNLIIRNFVALEVIINTFRKFNILKLFFNNLLNLGNWRKKFILSFIKDLLLLDTIQSIENGNSLVKESFRIDVSIDTSGAYCFVSIPIGEAKKGGTTESTQREINELICHIKEFNVKRKLKTNVIWDHRAIGTSITYRSRIFKKMGEFIYSFGNNGIHQFSLDNFSS